MTDTEFFAVLLAHLAEETRGDIYDARQELILSEIARREQRCEVARYVVRVDQQIPFAAGECGSGADYRTVQTSIHLKRGDELVVSRDRPELAILATKGAK